jgi:hypothetical protein
MDDANLQPSPIAAVDPDLHRMQKWNDLHGDTADPFWADDGNLYHFTCDGRGFGKEPRNLCFNKLEGANPGELKGSLVNSMDEYGKANQTESDGATWKATGQECVDGVFYAFVTRNTYGDKSGDHLMRQTSVNASLIKSTDRGLIWRRSAGENYRSPMWKGRRFGAPGFIHYGQDGGRIRKDGADRFVYAISNNGFWNGGDDFILARIQRADLPKLNAADWRYYSGGDGMADASWTEDLEKAISILSQPAKLGVTSPVFIPALNRYLLVSWYISPTLKKWFEPGLVTYDFYEAGHPWGPWTRVSSFTDGFLAEGQHMYGPNLCAKFQERIGDEVKIDLYTSGCPFEDKPDSLYKNWHIPLIVRTRPFPDSMLVNDDDPDIRYHGTWSCSQKRAGNDHHNDIHFSNTEGDSVEYMFSGTGIALLSEKFKDQGRIDVFIDGQLRESVSLKVEHFPRLTQIRVFDVHGLPAGKHTIRIVNKSSEYVAIDAFKVVTETQQQVQTR